MYTTTTTGSTDTDNITMNPPHHKSTDGGRRQEPEVPVNLGKPSLRRRLEVYYGLMAPDQIADHEAWKERFKLIWDKFGGSAEGEDKLAAKLAKKYGPAVRLQVVAASTAETKRNAELQSQQEHRRRALSQHAESWFQLNDKERGSAIVDFASDCFDPVAALAGTSGRSHPAAAAANAAVLAANPWVQSCPSLDRVAQFRRYLPPTDPLHDAAAAKRAASSHPAAASSTATALAPPSQQHKRQPPSCFASIAAATNREGPYRLLHGALQAAAEQPRAAATRLRVVVRHVNGIRGTLTGHLMAFDKHFNLILREANEVYSPRCVDGSRGVDGLSNVEVEVRRRLWCRDDAEKVTTDAASPTPAWSCRQRRLRQVLVRGDVVVSIHYAQAETSAWPPRNDGTSPLQTLYRKRSVIKNAVPPSQRVGTAGSARPERRPSSRRGSISSSRGGPLAAGATSQKRPP